MARLRLTLVPLSPSPPPTLSTPLNEHLHDAGSSTQYDVEPKGEIMPPARWSIEKEGSTHLPFFSGDLRLRELRVRAARVASYLLLLMLITTRYLIGTDTIGVKHRTSKWRAWHRTLCVLAPPSVFAGVDTERTAFVEGNPIKEDRDGEEEAG